MVGNLGADPETRYQTSGDAITNIRVATTDKWKDKASGENEGSHRVAPGCLLRPAGGDRGRISEEGSQVYIEGRMRTRKYQDKEGHERYSTEIIGDRMQMLGSRAGAGEGRGEPRDAPAEAKGGAAPAKKGGKFDDMEDDIPF